MIGSDGAEEEKKKSRGQFSGAGGEQQNAKESPLLICSDGETLTFFFLRSVIAHNEESGTIRFNRRLHGTNVSMLGISGYRRNGVM